MCGNNGCFGGNIWWIIILLLICGCGNGCGNTCGGGSCLSARQGIFVDFCRKVG